MRAEVVVATKRGKLQVSASAGSALKEALLTWPDGPVTLSVEREMATRSTQANAYYWSAVIEPIADHTGYTPDETHEILKVMFLPKDVAIRTGNGTVVAEFVLGGSTTKLSIGEFFDYVERIRQWAFEKLDVDIPPGDPAWRSREPAKRADSHSR